MSKKAPHAFALVCVTQHMLRTTASVCDADRQLFLRRSSADRKRGAGEAGHARVAGVHDDQLRVRLPGLQQVPVADPPVRAPGAETPRHSQPAS